MSPVTASSHKMGAEKRALTSFSNSYEASFGCAKTSGHVSSSRQPRQTGPLEMRVCCFREEGLWIQSGDLVPQGSVIRLFLDHGCLLNFHFGLLRGNACVSLALASRPNTGSSIPGLHSTAGIAIRPAIQDIFSEELGVFPDR